MSVIRPKWLMGAMLLPRHTSHVTRQRWTRTTRCKCNFRAQLREILSPFNWFGFPSTGWLPALTDSRPPPPLVLAPRYSQDAQGELTAAAEQRWSGEFCDRDGGSSQWKAASTTAGHSVRHCPARGLRCHRGPDRALREVAVHNDDPAVPLPDPKHISHQLASLPGKYQNMGHNDDDNHIIYYLPIYLQSTPRVWF